MPATALVDTNTLVYRFDDRFPEKKRIATDLLRRGIADDFIRRPHQAVLEFYAVMTRPLIGGNRCFLVMTRVAKPRSCSTSLWCSIPTRISSARRCVAWPPMA